MQAINRMWSMGAVMAVAVLTAAQLGAAPPRDAAEIDRQAEKFLGEWRGRWRDSNVPTVDGRALRDLIIEKGYKNVLEIGTSTGHSAIWMAWALSKTGGRLTTIEIDPDRHRTALANFKAAGLSDYIDARLADAHELVPTLAGPYDLVFSDADKDWYKNYFIAIWPKLSVGGCFTAHNVSSGMGGIREFLDYLKTVPNARTTFDQGSSEGISITCKTGR